MKSRRSRILRVLAMLLLVPASMNLAQGSSLAGAAGSTQRWPTVSVQGNTTNWKLQLVSMQTMYRIPHTTWANYASNLWEFWVLKLNMTDIGPHAASLSTDLNITLAQLPKYQSSILPTGWTQVSPTDQGLRPLIQAAAQQFGGALSWQVTQPGHTTLYSYLIGSRRGGSHYGLYNATPKGYIFLFDTGY